MQITSLVAATVAFSGLILHYEYDQVAHYRRAVLVKTAGHKPTLIITGTKTQPHTNTFWVKWKLQKQTHSDVWKYDLSGMRLILEGDSSGVKRSALFKHNVPSLPEFIAGNASDAVHDEIGKGDKLHGNTAAFLDYKEGELDVSFCHSMEIEFDPAKPKTDRRCIASKVVLELETDKIVILDAKNPKRRIDVALNHGVEIEFSNYDPNSPRGKHFKHYRDLLKNGSTLEPILETGRFCYTTSCKEGAPEPGPAGASVECSNTQWP